MKVKEYLIEATLKWTKETPTKKGYYFVKNAGEKNKFVIYFDGKYVEGTLANVSMDTFIGKNGFQGGDREWSGPIPEPKG